VARRGARSAAGELDEGRRFSICRPEALERLSTEAGMEDVAVRPVDVPTLFRDVDDYLVTVSRRAKARARLCDADR
jgi:hypothetical protein